MKSDWQGLYSWTNQLGRLLGTSEKYTCICLAANYIGYTGRQIYQAIYRQSMSNRMNIAT